MGGETITTVVTVIESETIGIAGAEGVLLAIVTGAVVAAADIMGIRIPIMLDEKIIITVAAVDEEVTVRH